MSPAVRSSRRLVRAKRRSSKAAAFFAFTSRRRRFPGLSGMCSSVRDSVDAATGLAAAVKRVAVGRVRVQPARARWVVGGEHRRATGVTARASAHGARRRALAALGSTESHVALADPRHRTPSCMVERSVEQESTAARMIERGVGRSARTLGSDPRVPAYYRRGARVVEATSGVEFLRPDRLTPRERV